MAKSDYIVFVSAGMLRPKKRDHPLARRQLYLNYGALTLASLLERSGHRSVLVHGEHQSPEEFLELLLNQRYLPSSYPVMLSIPSFYALPWARVFCRLLKRLLPESRIVVGGRWVVGPDPTWLKRQLPEASHFVPGLGEPVVERLVSGAMVPELRMQAPTPDFPLNHRLVHSHMAFQPSIEASRGCGMKCAFCEERDIRLEPLRDPHVTARFLEMTLDQYDGGLIHPYLQASFFAPNRMWAESLVNEVSARSLSVAWRTETRVDGMKPETVAVLASAGLKVLDLGLETASPRQILAMEKSKRPDHYLQSASRLLQACRDHGVWVKINVLLYAGEDHSTLGETLGFLEDHRDCLKGISVGPVIAYGPPRTADILIRDWKGRGAMPVDSRSAFETGITTMHLSSEIDASAAEEISLDMSRRFMNADDYFALKSFSYYPRDYTRDDFDRDVALSDPKRLPFRSMTQVDGGQKAAELG